ncbi:MAG TPA: hypothetical protein VFH80_15755 [Solirubrobacteraceae bacterium]|nr:hypothetical protein [Solirubrobacteraceae bacterium]
MDFEREARRVLRVHESAAARGEYRAKAWSKLGCAQVSGTSIVPVMNAASGTRRGPGGMPVSEGRAAGGGLGVAGPDAGTCVGIAGAVLG